MKLPDIRFDESNADYHADTEFIGNSMANQYGESPPAYRAYFVEKSRPKPPPSKPKRLGGILHAMVSENEVEYVRAADGLNPRMKAWGSAAKAALPRVLVSQDEWALAEAMFDAVRQHEEFQALVSGQAAGGEVLILEVKSARDPSPGPFAGVDRDGSQQRWGDIHYRGYDRQAAHYTEGIEKVLSLIPPGVHRECSIRWRDETTGLKLKCRPDIMAAGLGRLVGINWQWLAVRNTWPHDVYPYKPLGDLLQDARLENEILRDALARSYETGEWFAPEQYSAVEVGSPRRPANEPFQELF